METSTAVPTEIDAAVRADRETAFAPISFPVQLVDLPHPLGKLRGLGNDDQIEVVPGRKAVVRTDTREVLNIVSKKYPLVPHIEVFGAMDEAIAAVGVPVLDRKVTTAYSGGYAKTIWTLDREMLIDDARFKDAMKVTIHARNSYNYSSLVGLEMGAFRLICSNGAMIGKLLASARKRHVPSIKVPELIKQIASVLDQVEKINAMFNSWHQVEYSRDRFTQWLAKKPLPKAGRQEIIDYFQAQPDRVRAGGEPVYTGWEAFNALTWFATHRVKSRRDDTRLLAEEKVLELAEIFSREELEATASRSRN